jgi:hypothetical protein
MAVAVAAGTCWSVQGLGGIQLLGRYLEACLRAEPVPVSVERPHGGDDRHKACDKKRRKTPAPPPVRGRWWRPRYHHLVTRSWLIFGVLSPLGSVPRWSRLPPSAGMGGSADWRQGHRWHV